MIVGVAAAKIEGISHDITEWPSVSGRSLG
jgi:hypothetical protein